MRKRTPFSAILVLLVALIVPPILAFVPVQQNSRCYLSLSARMPKFRQWFRRKNPSPPDKTPPIIGVGSELPDVELNMVLATTGQGDLVISPIPVKEAMGRGMSILVALPAASTKSCSFIHVPGYKEATPKLIELGVRKICILLTCDNFVNQDRTGDDSYILTTSDGTSEDKWAERIPLIQTESTPVNVLVDSDETLMSQLGVTKEMGFGVRTNRLVVILEDGVVKQVLREEGVKDCTATSATRLVEFLTPQDPPPEENPEAIEVDFRIIIALGALLTILSYESLARFVSEQGWSIPFLPGFQTGTPTPVEEVFDLLKEHM